MWESLTQTTRADHFKVLISSLLAIKFYIKNHERNNVTNFNNNSFHPFCTIEWVRILEKIE